ncbi:MAG: hypothetical protein JWN48_3486 [Myxococcaceae bacterium]|nr:hypothetical protein [Myxococcaceae bacterium]
MKTGARAAARLGLSARAGAIALVLCTACQAASGQDDAQRPARDASARPAAHEQGLGVHDVGIFSELDPRVQLPLPQGLTAARVDAAVDQARGQLVLYVDRWPIKLYPLSGTSTLQLGPHTLRLRPGDRTELAPLLCLERLHVFRERSELPPGDADGDGIPDPLDVSLGARKTVLNADRYDGRYQQIPYPDGDVDRSIGVCTDVVIRAYRNAGLDLQRRVHEDILAAPRAYPMVKRANTSIDHRRVKSLLPYFQRHLEAHSVRLDDPDDPLRAGDVVFMDTFPQRPGTEHVGIVADLLAANGLPLVVNNWTTGTRTKTMELLSWVPVTHRFRIPAKLRAAGPISVWSTQLLVATSSGWDDKHARVTRYERTLGGPWRAVGQPMDAVLGHAGYAWGDGLHGAGAPSGRTGPSKREGDGRSPAGIFALGTLRGVAASVDTRLSYRAIDDDQHCVDDARSRHYNQVVRQSQVARDFESAEPMLRKDSMYDLALDVQHNRAPVSPDHGSCIFLHVVTSLDSRLTGCTGLSKPDLLELTRWLEPSALLVALPSSEYQALRSAWHLP